MCKITKIDKALMQKFKSSKPQTCMNSQAIQGFNDLLTNCYIRIIYLYKLFCRNGKQRGHDPAC